MSMVKIPRRMFLRGAAGATLALPLLESLGFGELPLLAAALEPAVARAQAAPFRYAVFMRQGNGVLEQSFWPSSAGALTRASLERDYESDDRALGLLAPYADKLTAVHGLRYDYSTTGCAHADSCLQCLTAAKPDGNNSNESLAMGPSLDWVISQALDPAGTEPVSLYAGATSSYLGDVILYRAARTRRAGERNPLNAYMRLFELDGAGSTDPNAAEQNRLALRRKSVNDIVRAQMQAVLARPELSAGDRSRLDAHFSAIRDLEVEMATGCQIQELEAFDASNVDEVVQRHMDIIALAMACGKSHVATMNIGNGNDQTQYTINGRVYERYHHISHRVHSDDDSGDPIPNAEALHHDIDKKFAGYFKYLLDRLAAVTTPTGTLLDDGVAVWLNDLADGPSHDSTSIPWILVGSAGGALRTGQYVRGDWTINRMHNTIGAALGLTNGEGAPLDDFGDPSYPKGHVDGLLA